MKIYKFFFTFKKRFYKKFTYIFYLLIFILIFINNSLSENSFPKLFYNFAFNENISCQKYNVSDKGFIVNFPNPFTNLTYIYIRLPQKDNCELKIYDLFGNLVKEFQLSGEEKYILVWDATNSNSEKVAKGGYVCVLLYMGTKIIRKIGYLR